MLKPVVSVVIPTYQHARFVGEAVWSVLRQTYGDREIIVVDDGSTDETESVLGSFGGEITVVRQRNLGLSAARNAGIRRSRGEYVAFLDSDDLWLPNKLQRQVPLLDRDPDVGLVGSDMEVFSDAGTIRESVFRETPPRSGMVYSVLFQSLGRSFVLMPTVMVRRVCFDQVGLFDETLSAVEDHDMWLRIARYWRLDFVQEVLARYRVHGANMHHNREKMLANSLEVQEKALAATPELGQIGRSALNRCLFSYFAQLALLYGLHGRRDEARALLARYMEHYRPGLALIPLVLASALPPSLIAHVARIWRFRQRI